MAQSRRREVTLAASRASSTPRAEGRLKLFDEELEEEILIRSDLIEHDMIAAKRDILGNGLQMFVCGRPTTDLLSNGLGRNVLRSASKASS